MSSRHYQTDSKNLTFSSAQFEAKMRTATVRPTFLMKARRRQWCRSHLWRSRLPVGLAMIRCVMSCASSFQFKAQQQFRRGPPNMMGVHPPLFHAKQHPLPEAKPKKRTSGLLVTLTAVIWATTPTHAAFACAAVVDLVGGPPPPWSFPEIVVASFLLPVLLGALQGAVAIAKYRSNFGDAPSPRIPCHGVVLVRPKDATESSSSSSSSMDLPDADDECLRLLVIGDSLAVGVGQSSSCVPIMPEEIAKEISKGTGKAVYWTCAGESGASTPWITRMVRQWQAVDPAADSVDAASVLTNADDDDDETHPQLAMEGQLLSHANAADYENGHSPSKKVWRENLDRYRALFDPTNMRPFDIVVLVTGANDLKNMLLPFMVGEEDKKLNKNNKERGGLVDDLRLFIQALNDKTELSVRALRDRLEQKVQRTLQDIRSSAEALAVELEVDMDESFDQIFGARNSTQKEDRFEGDNCSDGVPACPAPLFVLPGMPARAVPSLRGVPLKWLAVPVFDMMDRKKQDFAKTSPYNILFVKDPALEDIIDYEEERGRIWLERNRDVVLLCLRDIGISECTATEKKMKLYYLSKGGVSPNAETRLSELRKKPGTKSFALDGVHPNEFGYTVWGRHIGREIVQRWTGKQ